MDITTIAQLITGIGFPCAVAIYLLWSNREREKEFDAREERIINESNATMKEVTAALNNNTAVMQKVLDNFSK